MVEEILAFNRWSLQGVTIEDEGLKSAICLTPRIVPRTGGKAAKFRFHKTDVFVVERFINRLMTTGHRAKKHKITSGHQTGKGNTVYNIMVKTLELIEKKMNMNPVEVLIKAVEYAAPREEIITIEYGGAKYPKAVECAPQRRVDQAIKLMSQLAYHKSFNTRKSMVDTLAQEIMDAYEMKPTSGAIAKKLELERQADSSR
ncbi:30S ribosomal protein S7 [Candidatus Woesearchaeota archaeon]|jgi:small subunit ribosomal protein S7|nr:30S ribosomal protein S7 [Candidatus Woesearchaeota archaeon]MBT6518535.1 30S ribosomal protein S7 [Candidatus Woesearchaeota archaeon]MBT7368407.1 30S ribosomal protein S7 [Candidatus Woesearchaeota archaeon]